MSVNPNLLIHGKLWAHRLSFRHNLLHPLPAPIASSYCRKNQANMAPAEQDRFKNALQTIISTGQFGSIVAIHADMSHMMHSSMGPIGTQRFLPWHRVYLFELEQALQSHDPQVTIPYWDWIVDKSIPQWLQNFTPSVVVNGNPINVIRQPGVLAPILPTQTQLDSTMNQSNFTSFTLPPSGLEGLHNTVHMWVGGTMANIMTAPADLIFWMHHANVDRLWDLWQKKNPNQNPSLSGSDATMDPWPHTEIDTRKTTNFGYTYV